MKKMTGTLLALLFAGGLNLYAEEPSSSATEETSPTSSELATESQQTTPKKKRNIKNNVFWGGYINLSFGDYTVIGLEPMVGYRLSPKLSTGVKVRYDYIRDDRYAETRTTSTYGGSVFGRYHFTPKFYGQLEAATYNYEYYYFGGGSDREWVPFLFAGGGFRQPLSERSWLNVQILFDILQSEKSPYDNWEPFFSIGFGAGL